MYIGKAAQLSGTTVKSIRHYEEIGLLPEPKREGKYRIYSQQSVEVLTFIKCAQQLGFKLKELQVILNNYRGDEFPWDMAQRAIAEKKAELVSQIGDLQQLHDGLEAFENNLNDARQECQFERIARYGEKKPGQYTELKTLLHRMTGLACRLRACAPGRQRISPAPPLSLPQCGGPEPAHALAQSPQRTTAIPASPAQWS